MSLLFNIPNMGHQAAKTGCHNQMASGGLSPADIGYPLRALFTKSKNIHVVMGEVSEIDLKEKRVFAAEKGFEFDELIIAAGARNYYFKNEAGAKRRLVKKISGSKIVTDVSNIYAGTMIWAAGVRVACLADILAEKYNLPTDRGGRLLVNSNCTFADYPYVFVIGDMAGFQTSDGKSFPGVALVAVQQGKYVTNVILNLLRRLNRELGADFNIDQFIHHATYNPQSVEMRIYLISTLLQTVHIEALEQDFHFKQ